MDKDLAGFLSEYEAICKKYGMKVSWQGGQIYSEVVRTVNEAQIEEHVKDLRDEPVIDYKGNRVKKAAA